MKRQNLAKRNNHTNKKNKERYVSYASTYKGTKWHVSAATKVFPLKLGEHKSATGVVGRHRADSSCIPHTRAPTQAHTGGAASRYQI